MIEKIIIFLSGINCNKINPVDYEILLRSPGQGLDEKIEYIRDKILGRIISLLIVTTIGIVLVSIYALGISYIVAISILYLFSLLLILSRDISELRNCKLGRDGEKSVAQYLSVVARQLSKENANMYIFHDLLNSDKSFNIDHVVVTKKGIFIFETKTYRKEKNTTNKIISNGSELFKNGLKISSNLPLQVRGQAKWLQNELLKNTGKRYNIISSIVFVGWYVEGDKIDDINITTAKTIKYIIENQYRNIMFDGEELKIITSAIHKLATIKSQKDICV